MMTIADNLRIDSPGRRRHAANVTLSVLRMTSAMHGLAHRSVGRLIG
jgi:hypothetical protein